MFRRLTEDELDLAEFRLFKHARRSRRYGNEWAWWSGQQHAPVTVAGLGEVTILKESVLESGDDDGYLFIVFEIAEKNGDKFWVRKGGEYSSYESTTWDGDFIQVNPVPVQRVEYQPVR